MRLRFPFASTSMLPIYPGYLVVDIVEAVVKIGAKKKEIRWLEFDSHSEET